MRFNAVEPLTTFLDFITFEYMINNVLKLITAVRTNKDALDILHKCHPLGTFPSFKALVAAKTVKDMYETILVDAPIGHYFTKTDQRDFDDYSTDYLRALLQKNYLEDFYDYVCDLGGVTAEVMCEMLEFEADRQVLTITRQSVRVDSLPKDERKRLYPAFGDLADVHDQLADADDENQIKQIIKPHVKYYDLMNNVSKVTPLKPL
eukprot:CAMPEP_0117429264 /NCGR_PEP_ID=MMETSP0758-20121206/8826_1 /TAXON_ID=63605 /ORGANISM="Percolomonas cosmopolitus, Strain AE-1 (ATCC 50343)" /LENGTH=205 /DNA_ID=CAMNT_0005216155 /DNA_START=210 /DNA_END=828 /DNA_ORIENTATION=+